MEIILNTAINLPVWMPSTDDGRVGATGLTITINLSKAGGAFSDVTADCIVTERGNGWYDIAHIAGHIDTLGVLARRITAPGATERNQEHSVIVSPAKESTLIALGQLPQTSHVFTAGERIVVARGDKVDLPFALGPVHDCTGKKLFFCAKAKATDVAPLIDVECTLTDALNVVGTVPLTPTLLATILSGVYEYERRDNDGTSNPHTVVQGAFQIAQDVRQ